MKALSGQLKASLRVEVSIEYLLSFPAGWCDEKCQNCIFKYQDVGVEE
jgi:hypothetical protein